MRHRKTNMYVNFQQNRINRSIKTVHTYLFAKNCKYPREPWATPVLHDIKLVIKWISFKLA